MEVSECWRPISYTPNYIVSNKGRIKNTVTNKVLTPFLNQKGYLKVKLYFNSTSKTFFIHRLVATAFILNPNNLPQVNHKDENKSNNCVENLEWCSNYYNAYYGTHFLRMAETNKSSSKRNRFIIQYDLEGTELARFPNANNAARSIGKSNGTLIRSCCKGFVYMKNRNKEVPITQAYGFKWRYGYA